MADGEFLIYEACAATGECQYISLERRSAARRLLEAAAESCIEQRALAAKCSSVAEINRELASCSPLQHRDVHLLERSPWAGESLQPQILVRQACVVFRAGPVRAVIFTSRAWIFVDAGSDDDISPILARLSAFCARVLAEKPDVRHSASIVTSDIDYARASLAASASHPSGPASHLLAAPARIVGSSEADGEKTALHMPLPASMHGSELAAREEARYAAAAATHRAQAAAAQANAAADKATAAAAAATHLDASGSLPWELLCLEALLSAVLTHYSKAVARAEGRTQPATFSASSLGGSQRGGAVSLLAAASEAGDDAVDGSAAVAPLAAHLRQESQSLQRWDRCRNGICAFACWLQCCCRKGPIRAAASGSPGLSVRNSHSRVARQAAPTGTGPGPGTGRPKAASPSRSRWRSAAVTSSRTAQLSYSARLTLLQAASSRLKALRGALASLSSTVAALVDDHETTRHLLFPATYLALRSNATLAADAALAAARAADEAAAAAAAAHLAAQEAEREASLAAAARARSEGLLEGSSASAGGEAQGDVPEDARVSRRSSASGAGPSSGLSSALQQLASPLLKAPSARDEASLDQHGHGHGHGHVDVDVDGTAAGGPGSMTESASSASASASASATTAVGSAGLAAAATSPSPSPFPSTPAAVITSAGGWDASELPELLLEAGASHAEGLSRRVASLLEELESAEGHSRLLMNVSQNHIWVAQVLLSTVSCFLAACLAVAAFMGQNLGNKDKAGLADNHGIWLAIVIGASAAAAVGMLTVGGCVIFRLDVGTAARGAVEAGASASGASGSGQGELLPLPAAASVAAAGLGGLGGAQGGMNAR